MTLRNDKNGDRIDCKHLAVMLLLSFGLVLSFSLITATPSLAQDECNGGVANGAGEWYWPGWDGIPPMSGFGVFHLKECFHNQPAKGWIYNTDETGAWTLVSASVEGGSVEIVPGDDWWALDEDGDNITVEGEVAWILAQIVAASDPSIVGLWAAAAAFDGGTPGRNGDILFHLSPLDLATAQAFYLSGIGGNQILPLWGIIVKGNVIVKAK